MGNTKFITSEVLRHYGNEILVGMGVKSKSVKEDKMNKLKKIKYPNTVKTERILNDMYDKINEIVEWINKHQEEHKAVDSSINVLTECVANQPEPDDLRSATGGGITLMGDEPTECELCSEKQCWKRICHCWCHKKTENKVVDKLLVNVDKDFRYPVCPKCGKQKVAGACMTSIDRMSLYCTSGSCDYTVDFKDLTTPIIQPSADQPDTKSDTKADYEEMAGEIVDWIYHNVQRIYVKEQNIKDFATFLEELRER